MNIVFSPQAWEDYLYWQQSDAAILEKVNELIKSCCRDPFKGIGKPEPLKNQLRGFWSRRITQEHRLVYRIFEGELQIIQCCKHY